VPPCLALVLRLLIVEVRKRIEPALEQAVDLIEIAA
jgi:hypothetical protein